MGVSIKLFEFREKKVRIHSHTDVVPKNTISYFLLNCCCLVHKEYEQGKQN